MKVLFAVNNESIAESIVKKYQKKYKEIITPKNVYYFKAIMTEIQKDKSYDRIVISEDLEQFSNNNYEQIDKTIFEQLDKISDEASTIQGNDIPIILICSDRRSKSENMLVKLFGIGIYNAIIGNDRSLEEVCRLIHTPRVKKEAKEYYHIEAEDVNYQSENENDVSEIEIENILAHYRRIGMDEKKCIVSFDNIAAQYNDNQLRIIAKFLPVDVRAILEQKSAKYQSIMSFNNMVSEDIRIKNKKFKDKNESTGPTEKLLKTSKQRTTLSKPIVVPTEMNTNNVTKMTRKTENINQIKEVVEENMNEPLEETPKKRRGRPRKNPIPAEEENSVEQSVSQETIEEVPKKKRGRPKKIVEQINVFDLAEDDDEEDDDEPQPIIRSSENKRIINTLPDVEDEEDDYEKLFGNANYEDTSNYRNTNYQNKNNQNVDYNNYQNSNSYQTNELSNSVSYESDVDISNLLTGDKKIVSFIGTSKNGTSFIVNNVAEILSSMGIDTAILDTTQNRNSYYIYTKNEEDLRQVAYSSIENLKQGNAMGIMANRNLSVYTALPDEKNSINEVGKILETLVKKHSLILIDCDFETPKEYFANSQEIYLVQSMDVLTIQPFTSFLRDLKVKNILNENKIRIVLNKYLKMRNVSDRDIIGGMAFYNDPAMSFMTELFDKTSVKYITIPFEVETYTKYLEGLIDCEISLKGYSKQFMQSLNQLANMIYPLVGGSKQYSPLSQGYEAKSGFSPFGSKKSRR